MSIEDNKRIAREFFEALGRGDGKALMDFYAADAICWTAGTLPFSGTHTLDEGRGVKGNTPKTPASPQVFQWVQGCTVLSCAAKGVS